MEAKRASGFPVAIITIILVLLRISSGTNITSNNSPFPKSSLTFKDYIEKFNPVNVWETIDLKNKHDKLNKTLKDSFEDIFKGIDPTDELLSLKIPRGNPKILVHKDGRRWRPPGTVDEYKYPIPQYDPFHVKGRLIELIKQAFYQLRNKLIIMQKMRKKYNHVSVYKMGFLMAKTDRATKNFSKMAHKAIKSCSVALYGLVENYLIIDLLEVHARLLNYWFEFDLLKDLVELNYENCINMMDYVVTNRKNAWKFVD